jgi:hypothetical protein
MVDAADAQSEETQSARGKPNAFQRLVRNILNTPLPSIGKMTVFAAQLSSDCEVRAGLPFDAAAAVRKLGEYLANNTRGDAQISVDDFLRSIDPRRAAQLDVVPARNPIWAGVIDFTTGFRRVQTLWVETDAEKTKGSALWWNAEASAYQVKVSAVDGGYFLDGHLTVLPSESLTPLNLTRQRVIGAVAETLGVPNVLVRVSDAYRPVILAAGTRISRANLDLLNSALASPEYRSTNGTIEYTSAAHVVVSELPVADDDQSLFHRLFAADSHGEFGPLEHAGRRLTLMVAPTALGINIHNPPTYATRLGLEMALGSGPTLRELLRRADSTGLEESPITSAG